MSSDDLLGILHAHAAAFMAADLTLSAEAALAKSCALAVLIYDELKMEDALRTAAQNLDIPDTLARIVGERGGASAALSLPS